MLPISRCSVGVAEVGFGLAIWKLLGSMESSYRAPQYTLWTSTLLLVHTWRYPGCATFCSR